MITLTEAKTKEHIREVRRLYKRAFPSSERIPFFLIPKIRKTVIYRAENDGKFCGLAIATEKNDIVLLDYFAVSEETRGKGIGSGLLEKITKACSGRRLILEIETTKINTPELKTRIRRKEFYLKNGFAAEDYEAAVFGNRMEILTYNCRVSFEEYRSMYGILGTQLKKISGG